MSLRYWQEATRRGYTEKCFVIVHEDRADFFFFPTLELAEDMKADIKLHYYHEVDIQEMAWYEASILRGKLLKKWFKM